MSLVSEILKGLWETSLSYKGLRVNLFGVPTANKYRKSSFHTTLFRLSKKGFVENKSGEWFITNQGKKYYESLQGELEFREFNSPFENESPRNLLLMFDVPEAEKIKREWLRSQLKKFNYTMIQKSVWVGPSPLPKEFKDYLKEINIQNHIITFKLARAYKNKK